MKDIVIGCFSHHSWNDIQYWVNSLNSCGFSGIKSVIVSDLELTLVNKLVSLGFTVWQRDTYNSSPKLPIVTQRFSDIYNLLSILKQNEEIRWVITTDVRDVVFQKNPIEFLESLDPDVELVTSREGFTYDKEPWSKNNMIQSFGEEAFKKMKDFQINCAGTIAAKFDVMLPLCLDVWNLCQDLPGLIPGGGGPDQSAYNIVLEKYQNTEPPKTIHFSEQSEGWSCQLGTTLPAITAGSGAIGQLYKQSFFPRKYLEEFGKIENPTLKDGIVLTESGIPYYIVHQYNRIPEWKSIIEEKYSK